MNGGHKQGQENAGHRRGDRQFKVGAADRLRHGLWRAECVTKGACSVRRGATGDRGLRDPTAPVVYSTDQFNVIRLCQKFGALGKDVDASVSIITHVIMMHMAVQKEF